jgi:D-glycero-D-manno-heptose 1,7-bisphosphate phosphatase
MRPAVFLDRDGTIVDELGYITPASTITIYPWSGDSIRLLKRAGYIVVMVTNQGGIGLGLYDHDFVKTTHDTLTRQFADAGAQIDAWYYCPHHPEAIVDEYRVHCGCRKPAPGMLHDAARDLEIDLSKSWVIGDQWRDVQLAHATGCRSVLLRTGHGAAQEAAWPADVRPPTFVCDNLIAAVSAILVERGNGA